MAFNAGSFALKIELLGQAIGNDVATPQIIDIPVQITEANVTASFWTVVKADGGDIRASSDAGGANELAIHVQHIDTVEETLVVIVNIPTYTNAGRTVYLSVGNASANLYAVTDPFGTRAVYPRHEVMYHFDEPEFSTVATNHAKPTNGQYIAPWKNQGLARDTVLGTEYNPNANGNVAAGILRPNVPIGTYDGTGKEYYIKLVLDSDGTKGSLTEIIRSDNGASPFLQLRKSGRGSFGYRAGGGSGSANNVFSNSTLESKKAIYLLKASNALLRFYAGGIARGDVEAGSANLPSNALDVMAIGGHDGTGDWINYDASIYEMSLVLGSTRSTEFQAGGFFQLDTNNTESPETFWTLQSEAASTSYALNATIAEIPDGTYPTVVIDPAAQTVLFNGDVTWSGNNAVIGFNLFDTSPVSVEYYVHDNFHGAVGVGTANPL